MAGKKTPSLPANRSSQAAAEHGSLRSVEVRTRWPGLRASSECPPLPFLLRCKPAFFAPSPEAAPERMKSDFSGQKSRRERRFSLHSNWRKFPGDAKELSGFLAQDCAIARKIQHARRAAPRMFLVCHAMCGLECGSKRAARKGQRMQAMRARGT